jgi:hypothetical protein
MTTTISNDHVADQVEGVVEAANNRGIPSCWRMA